MHDDDHTNHQHRADAHARRLRKGHDPEQKRDAERGEPGHRVGLAEQQVRAREEQREAVRKALEQRRALCHPIRAVDVLPHVAGLEDEIRRVRAEEERDHHKGDHRADAPRIELGPGARRAPSAADRAGDDDEHREEAHAEPGEVIGPHQHERDRELREEAGDKRFEDETGPLEAIPGQAQRQGRTRAEQHEEHEERPQHEGGC